MDSTQSNILAVKRDLARIDLQNALPDPRMTAERFTRIALTTLRTNSYLARCSPPSILAALVESAQLGLMPDAAMGEAYLVPYGSEAKLIIGYRGMIKLMRQSGEVSEVHAFPVHEGDHFQWRLGTDPSIDHVPLDEPDRASRDITHVYAVVKFKDGGSQFCVMTAEEVEAIRKRSRAGNKGPWQTDYVAMALKTVIRRLAKMIPMSTLAERAMAISDAADTGEQRLRVPADLVKDDPEPATIDVEIEPEEGDGIE